MFRLTDGACRAKNFGCARSKVLVFVVIISFLGKINALAKRKPWLYPFFIFLRTPLIFPILIQNEGLFGASRWLYYRFKFALQNRKLLNRAAIFDQPIQTFHSRHGYTLSQLIEYNIYDEIFVDRCYEFAVLQETIRRHPECLVLDFGMHHGMFINYLQSLLHHKGEVFGAELNPETYLKASQRFAGQKNITLLNVGIGGYARSISMGLRANSTTQSIYSEAGDKTVSALVITPSDFLRKNNLAGREIGVLKMDIEGAEKEIFQEFDSIKDVLALTKLLMIEIHDACDVSLITERLAGIGFRFEEKKELVFVYAQPAFLLKRSNG